MIYFILFILYYVQSNVKAYQLNIRCQVDMHCPSLNTYCNKDLQFCVCKLSHPVQFENAMCLPALKLGEACDYSDSCRYLDVNSYCHMRKGCVCKDGFRPYRDYHSTRCIPKDSRYYGFWPHEDSSEEDEDDDDDDDNMKTDVAAPIIVGIVLGSAIVCGWSCVICRVYLKKLERDRARKHHRRLRRHKINHPTNRPVDSELDLVIDPQYTLLSPQTNDTALLHGLTGHRAPTIAPVHEPQQTSSCRSLNGDLSCTSSPLHLCPDEEPLPAYEGSTKDEIEVLPPSYEEVMRESNNKIK